MRLFVKQGLLGTSFLGTLLLGAAAVAQEPAAQLSLAAREASVPGGALMLVAYLALWLMIFGYLAMIMRRQRALSRELTALERRLDEAFGGQGD